MKSLKTSSSKPFKVIPKSVVLAFLIVSLLGFLDATYLTAKHYLGEVPTCSVIEGCEKVLTSSYATVGRVPVALMGAFYYLAIFFLTVAYLDTKRKGLFYFTARLTLVGFLVSLGLIYLQLFVIKAICLYCMASAASSTILFGLGVFVLKYR
jgi:uncharacterized membrane protein